MTEPTWYRQPGLRCEYCGAPGHLIPCPLPVSVAAVMADDLPSSMAIKTATTCPEHRYLVRLRHERIEDPSRFEYDHGRFDR